MEKNVLPELIYTLKRPEILKLVSVFGGESIYIPSPEELKFFVNCSLAAYYSKCKNKRWDTIQKILKIEDEELQEIKTKVRNWEKTCSKDEMQILKNFSG